MTLGDDPIEIMARLRNLMGDLDRAVIDLRRLQRGGSVEVRYAADPCKILSSDLAQGLLHLLERLENSPEYKQAVAEIRDAYRDNTE